MGACLRMMWRIISLSFILLYLNVVCQGAEAAPWFSYATEGDTVRVTGTVVGEEPGERLPGAYVYVGEERRLAASTDTAGVFRLALPAAREVVLSVSYVGYETFSGLFRLEEDRDLGEIRLRSVTLDEVVVRERMPVTVRRGDTTVYNAGAVKVAPDADLEALVRKFPGLEVVDGRIMANGKEVVKIYIDGQEYALGNPAEVLRNLPAKLVERMAVYDEMSRMAELGGFDDGTRYRVLNFETVDPERTKVFGSASAGYGMTLPPARTFEEHNYQAGARGNVFSPKHKWTASGMLGNRGMSGTLPEARRAPERGRARSGMVFANVSSVLKEGVDLTGSYNYSGENGYSASLSREEYFPTERYDTRVYGSEQHAWQKGANHRASVDVSVDKAPDGGLTVSGTVQRSRTEGRNLSFGENLEDGDTVNVSSVSAENRSRSTNVTGSLMWVRNFGTEGRMLSVSGGGGYSQSATDSRTNSRERAVDEAGAASDTARHLLNHSGNRGWDWNVGVDWSEPLAEAWHLDVRYGYRMNTDRREQESRVFRDEGFTVAAGVDTAQTNDLRNSYRVHSGGASVNYMSGRWMCVGGMDMNHTRMDNRYRYIGRGDSVMVSRYVDVMPALRFNYSLEDKGSLSLNYSGSSSSPNTAQLQDVLTVESPLSVTQGNPELRKSFRHSVDFYAFLFNPENYRSCNVMCMVSQTFHTMATDTWVMERDTVVKGYALSRGAQLRMPVNLEGEWSFSASGGYAFPWEKAKLQFHVNGGYSFSRTPSVYDHVRNMSHAHTANASVRVSANISEYVDFSVASSSGATFSRNTETANARSFNETLDADFRWECAEGALRGCYLQAAYNGQFYLTWQGGTRTSQPEHLLSATVGKKFGRENRWNVSLSCEDILQNRRTMNFSLGDLSSTTSYSMMPSACVMVGISYRFDNIGQGGEE